MDHHPRCTHPPILIGTASPPGPAGHRRFGKGAVKEKDRSNLRPKGRRPGSERSEKESHQKAGLRRRRQRRKPKPKGFVAEDRTPVAGTATRARRLGQAVGRREPAVSPWCPDGPATTTRQPDPAGAAKALCSQQVAAKRQGTRSGATLSEAFRRRLRRCRAMCRLRGGWPGGATGKRPGPAATPGFGDVPGDAVSTADQGTEGDAKRPNAMAALSRGRRLSGAPPVPGPALRPNDRR